MTRTTPPPLGRINIYGCGRNFRSQQDPYSRLRPRLCRHAGTRIELWRLQATYLPSPLPSRSVARRGLYNHQTQILCDAYPQSRPGRYRCEGISASDDRCSDSIHLPDMLNSKTTNRRWTWSLSKQPTNLHFLNCTFSNRFLQNLNAS